MEGFVIRQNIEHYRRMLEQTTDESVRQQILRLLKKEEDRLANFLKKGDGRPL